VARVLYDESEIFFTSKVDRSLGILRLPNVDTDGRNTSLLAWDIEGDVQITRIDGAVRESIRLKIGNLHGAWEIRPKGAIAA